jgi:hypothetical protein
MVQNVSNHSKNAILVFFALRNLCLRDRTLTFNLGDNRVEPEQVCFADGSQETSGETHGQILDLDFDTGDIRAGGGASDGHTSHGRDEQQQAYKEA